MLFDVDRTTIAGRPALTVRGELDIATAPRLAEAAEALLAAGPEGIVVDLAPTAFLDSSGARTLIAVARKAAAAGVELHVVAPRSNRPVRLPIDLLELHAVIPIVNSAGEVPSPAVNRDAT
ncbi:MULTISPECIES: STAS domain-containing protein [unclassified Blastococcus]